MTKKVLIMTQNFYPVIGSAGNRMKNIFQLLNENDIETDVLTTEPAYPNKNLYRNEALWDDETLNKTSKKVMRVPIKNKKFANQIFSRLFFYLEIMYRFIVMLWKLRKEKYDYILVSTPPIFIVFSAIIGKHFMKTRLILEVRDLWPDSLIGVGAFDNKLIIKFVRFLERRMYRVADEIIINSKGFEYHIKERVKKGSPPIIYLPNGPRTNEVVEQKEYEGEFRVVYTGNIGLAQDVNRIKLIAGLLKEEEIRFDVIAYGVKTVEFVDYLKENHLDNVHVYQPTTRKNSLKLIENSNVAIAFLNEDDVFSTVLPGKIIDYMTCKTPIVAGVKGIAAQVIVENKVGFPFESTNVHGMVDKIVELKNNPNELSRLGDNCTQTIKNGFLWESNIKRLREIII